MNKTRYFKAVFTPTIAIKKFATWEELHKRALVLNEDDSTWLMNDFTPRVAQISCTCRANWSTWIASNPPDWSNYFEWTVNAHNAVNIKLFKNIVTIEDALKMWSAS